MRLHGLFALDGTPRAIQLVSADRPEREIGLSLIARAARGGETIICDKGYAGAEFETAANQLGTQIARPGRRDEPDRQRPSISPVRQRVESIFWTLKDLLTLERHGARTLHNLRARIATGCSRSPPASGSTTNSADHHAQSPTTPPDPVESII